MGFFSWKTQDTDRSIANKHSGRLTFPVYMIDDKGNEWYEPDYDGYGTFGGKDYYELLAEMNGLPSDRMLGIELAFKDTPSGYNTKAKFPNLVEEAEGWDYVSCSPESCEYQGYFYFDEDSYDYGELNY
jgi:hypothetical protein